MTRLVHISNFCSFTYTPKGVRGQRTELRKTDFELVWLLTGLKFDQRGRNLLRKTDNELVWMLKWVKIWWKRAKFIQEKIILIHSPCISTRTPGKGIRKMNWNHCKRLVMRNLGIICIFKVLSLIYTLTKCSIMSI